VNKAFLAAFLLGVFVFSLASAPHLSAQTTQPADAAAPNKDAIEWPQFAKDLRRFDVITFGLFPFAYLVTSIGYDLMRSAQHGWDAAYYPWPVKGSASWGSEDYGNVILGSAVLSLSVAAIDLVIILIKRHAAEKKEEARSRPETDIRRSPFYEE
jgi:hypothetical protein